jgi:integrase
MAWLETRSGRFRVGFRYLGKKYHFELKTENQREANALVGRLEDNLILLERGKLNPPADGDLGTFLISDGKINEKPKVEESLPLSTFFRRYRQEYPTGAKEPNTRYTETIHIKHLERLIGARTGIRSITTHTLQEYIDERSKEKGRNGEVVSHATIQKEIGSFASIWNKWAMPSGLITIPAPTKGLIYSKSKTKPPFQTWKQIEQQIKRGGLSSLEQESLWESLFLSLPEIAQLLDHVKKIARFDFVYPMFVFAAHTGARRSEILRSQIDDFNFADGVVRVREKKKDRSRELSLAIKARCTS